MQVFDLPHLDKLPTAWIDPFPMGPGDLEVSTIASMANMPGHNSSNWKTDFPMYVYEIAELQSIKKQLNASKAQLTKIHKDHHLSKQYNIVADRTRAVYLLRRPSTGTLLMEYNAEVVTNAWLKMYELMGLVKPPPPKEDADGAKDKGAKVKRPPTAPYRTFHMAEAPGNFMLSINHYLYSNYPKLDWIWYANTMRPLYTVDQRNSHNSGYLQDDYNMISRHPDKWLFGADGDGDITSDGNLRSFPQDLPALCDLVTSDVKYVPADMNFDEEEMINVPVHIGHFIGALLTLKKGGSVILKEFTQCETPSVSLLMLGCHYFDKYQIVKPLSSRTANSEIYLVGTGFRGINNESIERLLRIMKYYRYLNTEDGSPALFLRKDIPDVFLKTLIKIQQTLLEQQVAALAENLQIVHLYPNETADLLIGRFSKQNKEMALKWIENNPIKKLPDERRIGNSRNRVDERTQKAIGFGK
jgi:hypothetical protein